MKVTFPDGIVIWHRQAIVFSRIIYPAVGKEQTAKGGVLYDGRMLFSSEVFLQFSIRRAFNVWKVADDLAVFQQSDTRRDIYRMLQVMT